MKDQIEIIIADDHPIVRRGLRQVIEGDAQLKVLADVGDGEEALRAIQELRPKVAVLDIDMPLMDGFAVAREVKKQNLAVEIVFLTIHSAEDLFNEALALGAHGYLLKGSAVTDVIAAIKAVAIGQYFVTPMLASYLVNKRDRAETRSKTEQKLELLTPTEWRILKMIADSKTSREIADELFIHYRTVENHRSNICQKLDLHGHNALVRYALKHRAEI